MVDNPEAERSPSLVERSQDFWFDRLRIISSRWHNSSTRKWAKVGLMVCCCDGKHREIATVDAVNDDVVMTDGGHYGFVCIETAKPDGSCHTYLEQESD